MPDHAGAFLRASRCIAALGINITRVSYNKAVDLYTLFIEVDGSEEQLKKADEQLSAAGYLSGASSDPRVVLLEFRLEDVPGSVTSVLELINEFHFNISYMSSQENGTPYQFFRMGLFVENREDVDRFISRASDICSVRMIDYSHTEKNFDNSIFYNSFASGLSDAMDLTGDTARELMINVNLAMQTLDERDLSPYTTFDCISHFADLLAKNRGDNFAPRITVHTVTPNTSVTVIEPPCGSNTMILSSMGSRLFIDTGYACYRDEMMQIFRKLIPDFDASEKQVLITHADVDHCGLLDLFDTVYMSRRSSDSLKLEYEGKSDFREQNQLHAPYIHICKILTYYCPVSPAKMKVICDGETENDDPLVFAGYFDFGELHFEIYEGAGGHLPGEILLIDYKHRIAFPGDIYINIEGLTPQQAEYNNYAPILMTSVDTDPVLASAERRAFLGRIGAGNWSIFGSHGMMKEYNVRRES